uniref:Uncharacterized protein n=1 Tax=viral metagenome TaxID=1070528 RepID=A0A6C0JIP3_9ZZZZ
MLPKNVLLLINEYSKPVTRPDWRTIKILTQYRLFINIQNNIYKKDLFYNLYKSMETTEWFYTLNYISRLGIESYIHKHKTYNNNLIVDLLKMEGIRHAQKVYIENLYKIEL